MFRMAAAPPEGCAAVWYGLDSWDDMSNYEGYLIHAFPNKKPSSDPRVLGIDTACGLPILQINIAAVYVKQLEDLVELL